MICPRCNKYITSLLCSCMEEDKILQSDTHLIYCPRCHTTFFCTEDSLHCPYCGEISYSSQLITEEIRDG